MDHRDETVSIGSWIFTIIISVIPIVNFIYWLVLLFGGGNRNKVNLIRANVILCLIPIIILIAVAIIGSGTLSQVGVLLKELITKAMEYIQQFLNQV